LLNWLCFETVVADAGFVADAVFLSFGLLDIL
jgi:hypothetical protein